jgi:hypothetical protein
LIRQACQAGNRVEVSMVQRSNLFKLTDGQLESAKCKV